MRIFSTVRFVVLAVSVALASMGPSARAESSNDSFPWKAAAGSVVITPTRPMWMAGYSARDEPSQGTAQDLYAKALVLEDNRDTRFVVVTTDLIGVPRSLREDVVARCREDFDLPAEGILLNASHTHCGPELRSHKIRQYGIDSAHAARAIEYQRNLSDKIVGLIGNTLDGLAPARLEWTHARAGFAMNRRLPTEEGVINSPYPDGPVDHDVPVLLVMGKNDQPRAILFGYACHNTTLSFQKFCGDYAGFAQQYLEEAHPKTTCLFLAGCGGDQNPYPRRTLELAKQHGRALANAVEAALEVRRRDTVAGPLRSALDMVELEFQKPSRDSLEQDLHAGNKYEKSHAETILNELEENGRIRTQYAFPVQVVSFGDDLLLVALPGESVVDYSLRFKKELATGGGKDPRIWVAGYSNLVFGYLPSLRVLREGGYEGARAMTYTQYPGPFTESVEKRVVGTVHNLVDKVRNADDGDE